MIVSFSKDNRFLYQIPLHLAHVLADGCLHHKISAIKLTRDLAGAGLLQCRMIVESLAEEIHDYKKAELVSIRGAYAYQYMHHYIVVIELAP